jgi:hypothetical protein
MQSKRTKNKPMRYPIVLSAIKQGPFKFDSVSIEGPLETDDGKDQYYKVLLESADDDECPMSNYLTRHFFKSTHALIFKHCEKAQDMGTNIHLKCFTSTLILDMDRVFNKKNVGNYLFICYLLDEKPLNVFIDELLFQEMRFKKIWKK